MTNFAFPNTPDWRDLYGCISQGQTREEAIENIREAIALYIEALEADGLPVPKRR